jgi:very-short-patch-repair endonuclease
LSVSGTAFQRVAAIAGVQRGCVARRQLLAAGITSSAIARMVAQGLLRREHVGVYALHDAGLMPLGRETAALLACGERAVLSHTSAAAVWGLIPAHHGPVEITLGCPGTGRRRPAIRLHRSGILLIRDVRIKERLPLTSPAWTLLDLAGRLDGRSLERALDEALVVLKIVSRAQMVDVLRRANGRPGASLLRSLMARRKNAAITHSTAERRCLELIRQAGLPEPQTQVRIAGYTVDFLWPAHRVVFEIDGYNFHTSRFAFDRDRRKDGALKAAGYDANRLTRDQVMFEPYLAVAAIAAALTRAAEP